MVVFDLQCHKNLRKEHLELDVHFAGSYTHGYICDNLNVETGEVTG